MTIDYKNTLNLPQTPFSMKANLNTQEPKWLAFWQDKAVYQQLREARRGCAKFVLHDGPPYANGPIHLGHAYGKILKDMLIKSKSLQGLDAPYVPGWDCHGLPIEVNVEKQLAKEKKVLDKKAFYAACRHYAEEQVAAQKTSFIRLGVIGDWEHPYLTMAPSYEADIIRALADIMARGHLHRGYKPVHWCMDCGSALAEAEVEYEDKSSPSIYVRFRVVDEALFWQSCHHTPGQDVPLKGIYIPIWTTTPWTLPANQAVALHAELDYALIEVKENNHIEYYLCAQALVNDFTNKLGLTQYRVAAYCQGKALEGLLLQHPLYDRQVPVILGSHVTIEAGTGAVHTAPAHGLDDYLAASKYNLPVTHEVNAKGCFNENLALFGGQHIFKANDAIIEVLKTNGALLHMERISHSYPHCWRHKTPVIFRATPQWFISMQAKGLRETALQAISTIQFVPSKGAARLTSMIANRPDWCISRQRLWGTPMVLWCHKETHELHPKSVELMRAVADIVAKSGIEAWADIDLKQFAVEDAEEYFKIEDTLDVWVDSGVSYYAVLMQNPALHFPADIYVEGSDQHRGWFQSSLLSSIAATGEKPYKAILTHGFTVDAEGRKMSKSLGNVIVPEKIVTTLGADILRLWVAGTDYKTELTVSDEILQRNADVYRRIRNTARFLLANTFDFDPAKDSIAFKDMVALDQWVVDRTYRLQQDIINAYEQYQFHTVYQKIHHFCSIDLGSFYLDVIKDRQYTVKCDALARRSAQTAMMHILEALVRWLMPMLSFTAEEIWQCLPGPREPSVLLATYYQGLSCFEANTVMGAEYFQTVMQVRDEVNKVLEGARAAGILGSGLEANVIIKASPPLYEVLTALKDELRFVLITSQASVQLAPAGTPLFAESTVPGLCDIRIEKIDAPKCVRCWHRRVDVGKVSAHPDICQRCVDNIDGVGETRCYA